MTLMNFMDLPLLINGWDGPDGHAGNPTLWVQTCYGTVAASLRRRGGPIPANQFREEGPRMMPRDAPSKGP